MIPQEFEYHAPATLAEALALLANPEAKALAGGMSLIPLMKLRLSAPAKLIDLRYVPGLASIEAGAGELRIGARVTHYELESTPLVRTSCPLLAETAAHIGDVQVRNMGTLGGSVAHSDPAADYPAALLALEATLTLVSASGQRTLAIDQFLLDTFTTALEPGELISTIKVSTEASGTGTSYQKCLQPASGFALVGIAARVRLEGGKVRLARVGVTGLAGKPYRALNVERLLEGSAGSPEDIRKAAAVVTDGVEPLSDLHASAPYRAHLARVYTARALSEALARIR